MWPKSDSEMEAVAQLSYTEVVAWVQHQATQNRISLYTDPQLPTNSSSLLALMLMIAMLLL
jgi:hypothetical protein